MSKLVPLTVVFDDLMRHYDQFSHYDPSQEFLEFVVNQEGCHKKWNEAEGECKRLQRGVEESHTENARLERKIQEIRKHLEGKIDILNKANSEKERITNKNNAAKALIKVYLKDTKLTNEWKERLCNILAVLEGIERPTMSVLRSPAQCLDTISEAGSTDLSMTQSEDDLDVSVSRRLRSKRSSLTRHQQEEVQVPTKKSRQSGSKQTLELNTNADQLIAKTVVTFPKDGTIQAVASLKTYQSGTNECHSPAFGKPSAPPMPTSDSESDVGGWMGAGDRNNLSPENQKVLIENQRVATQLLISSQQSPRFGRTLSSGGAATMRPHAFCQKTVIKPETCEPCGKRIKFGKHALKCRDCKATCHPECKDQVPLPCVPTGTPRSKHQMGTIADYVPDQHPMVPALIQHCVNEVEIRGLDSVGLYRVAGAEREVKDLKEKFLRGKGVPNLAKSDIFAICSCIKDFLRSLQEPLISKWFWNDFAKISEYNDVEKRQEEMQRIVKDLPPPNQDTLAFMIIHLQRVAEIPEVKMPIDSLAKIFGPTLVGYSDLDLDGKTMLKETKKQQIIVLTLLSISSDFWKKFIYRTKEEQSRIYTSGGTYTRAKGRTMQSPYTPHGPPSMSNVDRIKNNGKKIYFSDDSPKEYAKTRSRKRNYFD